MKCWRIDLQRKLIYYLNNELSVKEISKLEKHFLDCGFCRTNLAHLRTSQTFVQQLQAVSTENLLTDPWDKIETAIKNSSPSKPFKINSIVFLIKPHLRAASWFLGGVLLASLLISFFKLNHQVSSNKAVIPEKEFETEETEFSEGNFRLVSINEMPSNTEPHVVTEGYVSEIRIDSDGDTTFKLVESLAPNQPFVVCEVIDPIKLTPPKIGSKVKVYGVSRYDDKANHKWYEVHPVLNIELVKN